MLPVMIASIPGTGGGPCILTDAATGINVMFLLVLCEKGAPPGLLSCVRCFALFVCLTLLACLLLSFFLLISHLKRCTRWQRFAELRGIALNYGDITRKSRTFSRVITHILRVNWREVEFAAIYSSKVLSIDTREIAHERARGLHTSFVRAFELTGANSFYARSCEITPPHVTARAA